VVLGYNEHGKAHSPFIKSTELLYQLKEIKYFDLWTQVMAQNRVWFQAIINMVTNIHLS
jgi:hypothetical protein